MEMTKRRLLLIGALVFVLGVVGGGVFVLARKQAVPKPKTVTQTTTPKKTPAALPKEVAVPLLNNERTPSQKNLVSYTGTLEKLPACLANLICFKLGEIYATELTLAKVGVAKVFPSDSFLDQYMGKKVTLTGTTVSASGDIPSYLRVYKLAY